MSLPFSLDLLIERYNLFRKTSQAQRATLNCLSAHTFALYRKLLQSAVSEIEDYVDIGR